MKTHMLASREGQALPGWSSHASRVLYTRCMASRQKLSLTVKPRSCEYLRRLVRNGKASNLSEAFEVAIDQARRVDNRLRLERDTAAYFAGLPPNAAAEESRIERALAPVVDELDFDR